MKFLSDKDYEELVSKAESKDVSKFNSLLLR